MILALEILILSAAVLTFVLGALLPQYAYRMERKGLENYQDPFSKWVQRNYLHDVIERIKLEKLRVKLQSALGKNITRCNHRRRTVPSINGRYHMVMILFAKRKKATDTLREEPKKIMSK